MSASDLLIINALTVKKATTLISQMFLILMVTVFKCLQIPQQNLNFMSHQIGISVAILHKLQQEMLAIHFKTYKML